MPKSAASWREHPGRRRRWWRRLLHWSLLAVLSFLGASALLVLALRWLPPPASAFMLARSFEAWRAGETRYRLQYQWRPWERVSAALPIALVASEDQKFPLHHGFDWDAIGAAWQHNQRARKVRGASTISQQTAKNLFLWSGRSWPRKGLEVYFTAAIELLWPKRRILEVYLNIAEFGDGVYGAQAASRAFFRKDALALTGRESALLAAALPSPRKLHPDRPSPYLLSASAWVERQVVQLGGAGYLDTAQEPESADARASKAGRR